MPKLSTLARDQALVVIPIGGERLTVAYRPSRATPNLLKRIAGADQVDDVLGPLSELLVSWDLLDDDSDQPIPTTPEGLGGVPMSVLSHVAEGIAGALSENGGR